MWREMSNPAILVEIGKRLKEYRIRNDMTQKDVAEHAGVGIDTVLRVERGDNISTLKLIAILRSLDMLENLNEFIPKPPVSPILYKKLMGKQRYRVRKR